MEFAFHVSPPHRSVCVSQGYLKFFELLFSHIILSSSCEQVALTLGAPFMMFLFDVTFWKCIRRPGRPRVIKHYLWNSIGTPTREKWDNFAEIRRAQSNVSLRYLHAYLQIDAGCSTEKRILRERNQITLHTSELKCVEKLRQRQQRQNRK